MHSQTNKMASFRWWALMAGPASSMKTSSLMAWTLSRTMNPVHAGFTARTVIIRSALPNGWMNAAANHSKLAKAAARAVYHFSRLNQDSCTNL